MYTNGGYFMAQYPPPPPQQQPVYYPVYYPVPAPAPQKRSGCLTCLLITLVVGLVGCVVLVGAGVGGYFLFKNNTITERQVLSWVGKAPGEANIVNLGDEALNVTLTPLDSGSESAMLLNNQLQLEPLDIDGFAMNPGRYQLDFTFPSGEPESCILKISSGDYYQFVATGQGVVVANEKNPVQSGADVRVTTSALCQQ
jgi:hypothetical protein